MPESMMQPDLQDVADAKRCARRRWRAGRNVAGPGPKDEAWRFTRLARWINYRCGRLMPACSGCCIILPTHMLPAGRM